MSGNPSAGQEPSQQWSVTPKDYEEYMTWRIRWYVVIAITIAYALSLIGGLIAFAVTKDSRFLLFITPTVLIPFIRYLIPMDKKEHEQKMAKINAKKELTELRLQVTMLKAELGKQQDNESTLSAAKQQGQLPTK
jgi:hypothetical protein